MQNVETRLIEFVSLSAIAPGKSGMATHRLERAANVVMCEVDPLATLLSVRIGTLNPQLAPGQTWPEALASSPVATPGTHVTLIVRNDGDASRVVQARLLLANEHGEALAAPEVIPAVAAEIVNEASVTTPTGPKGTIGAPRIIQGVIGGSGSGHGTVSGPRVQRSGTATRDANQEVRGTPKDPRTVAMPPTAQGKNHHRVVKGGAAHRMQVRSGVLQNMRPTAPIDVSATAESPVIEVGGGVDTIAPGEGERVALLDKGHAHALLRLIDRRAPLNVAFKPSIVRAITSAMGRKEASTSWGANKIPVVLTPKQMSHLASLLNRGHRKLAAEDSAPIIAAINAGFQRDIAKSKTSHDQPAAAVG